MNIEDYRLQYLKWHRQYERRAYTIFRKAIIQTASRIPIDNLTYENYKVLIPVNIHKEKIEQAYIEVYRTIGLIHGNRVGRGINRDIKNFLGPLFNRIFQNDIVDWVRRFCGDNIISVSDTIAKTIISLVEKASADGLTLQQMQKFIRDRVNTGLSRYEVLRIARTETGAAANHAALVSGETSGIVLEKVWISSQNTRTRRKPKDQFDHYDMNGKSVEQYEKFVMPGKGGIIDRIDFPCDPKGSPGNIIQCRCAVALRPKRDADGFVIRR